MTNFYKITLIAAITSLTCFDDASAKVNIASLLPSNYDLTEEPTHIDGRPLTVGLSWNIKGIFDVNFKDMTVLLSMYFRIHWDEPRLIPPAELFTGDHSLPVHTSILKKIWLPDVYIHEAVDINSFSMIQDVQGVYLQGNYTILFSSLLQTRLACPMFFGKYPFDVQHCSMTVSSYNFGEDKIKLKWMKLGVSAGKEVNSQVPNYNFRIQTDDITSKVWCQNCSFSPSSVGRANLIFERRYGGHLLTVYLPSALVVSLAWVSFFWPPDAVPGRTVLIITSLLTIISMYGAIGMRSPETSYLKAVDVWMFICVLHVVLALFQYAIIITIRRKQKERSIGRILPKQNSMARLPPIGSALNGENKNSKSPSPTPEGDSSDPASAYKTGGGYGATVRLAMREHWVERAGQIGLPVLFFLCCLVYWPCYLS